MIYLIGGSPRCGKTTLATLLSKKLNIPWIATDTLESMVVSCVSKKDFRKYFPKSVIRRKTRYSNDMMYTRYSTKQITKAYIQQSKVIWKAVERLVESELKEGREYIIEGYHIHPSLVIRLKKKFGARNIRSVFLTKLNVDGIVKLSERFTSKTDWFIQKTKNKDTYGKIALMIRELSMFYKDESKRYKIKVFNIDKNFRSKLFKAQKYLTK